MANISAPRDNNRVPVLIGTSSTDGTTPVTVYADPTTHRLKVDLAGGAGTVTSVSVVTANGVSGSVATATTTPAIILTLGAITPSTVNGITFSGTGTIANSGSTSLTAFTGSGTSSGTNTGDNATNSQYSGLATSKADVGQTFFIGTTSVAINRTSAALTLAGITLTTPNIGTPSAGVLTNTTGLPAASVVAGTLGTGAYVMDTKLTVPQVITTANAIAASGNAATIPVTSKNNIVTNNSAATLTITLTTAAAVNMQTVIVQILDFSAVAQTLVFVNTENSTVSVPATSNGSTSLPLTVGFIYNSATSKWRCVASA